MKSSIKEDKEWGQNISPGNSQTNQNYSFQYKDKITDSFSVAADESPCFGKSKHR